MDDSKPAPPRNPSRTLVIALVAVLVVVAIAGIVLAAMRGRTTSTGPSLSSPTQQGGDAPTAPAVATVPAVAAEAGAGPNQLAFASASDTLTPASMKKIADLALVATKGSHSVGIAAKLEAGTDREKRMEMAKKRAETVRKALQAAGMSVNFIKVQISEYPPGLVTPIDADRVELSMK